MSSEEFCSKDGCYRDMVEYLRGPSLRADEHCSLDLLAVTSLASVDEKGSYTRELLIASMDERRLDSVNEYLVATEPVMELEVLALHPAFWAARASLYPGQHQSIKETSSTSPEKVLRLDVLGNE